MEGWVYFIQARGGGPVKIGFAANVKRRLGELQVGSPVRLWVLARKRGTPDDERAIHESAKSELSHGEWFKPTYRLRGILEATLGKIPARFLQEKRIEWRERDYIHPSIRMELICKFCELGPEDDVRILGGVCYDCARRLVRDYELLASPAPQAAAS